MLPNQICKVLSTIQKHQVRALLMGGQACVVYGSAIFSRDIDFAILAEQSNLSRLQTALQELQAEVIAVPPFELQYLDEGLAVHFRCRHPEADDMRVDVMSRMRGVAEFEEVWNRRTTAELADGTPVEVMGISDLVQAKKTQRDKDWPMVTRLVDWNYKVNFQTPTLRQIEFWLAESRTPEVLIALVERFPAESRDATRPAVIAAKSANHPAIIAALRSEEDAEREADRVYWAPLRARLERLRRAHRQK
ncbi:hypothetical protein [Anatilimnocola floriformis]|uniref:hypothetical protein n=1 Tax=Anatilimnocola floriformis TaxID=2948575 RepID=UPI0020C4D04D|nr:hypothetical protein [Anatilimnocola floriformis]